MRIPQQVRAWTRLSYASDDGSETEEVWNVRDGKVPGVIALRSGTLASLKAVTFEGPGWEVPPGTRLVVDGPAAGPGNRKGLGWPGKPHLRDPEA